MPHTDDIDDRLARIEKQVGQILACLHGDLEKPGLMEMVRNRSETAQETKGAIDALTVRVFNLESCRIKAIGYLTGAAAVFVAGWELFKQYIVGK